MPAAAKDRPKRVSKNISLPPHVAARLAKESDARLINESLLVERALNEFFEHLPSIDGETAAEPAATPPPK